MVSGIKTVADKAAELGCVVIPDAELRDYTSFRIGGRCDLLVKINGREALKALVPLAFKLKIPYYIFGNGSNLIVDDKGIRGVVFLLGYRFSEIDFDGDIITCDAGVSLSKLCNFALKHEIAGLEFAYGIPGTVGGAVYMNAGAYGGEIKDVILSAQAMDSKGNIYGYTADSMELSYRSSIFMKNNHIIISAAFKSQKGRHDEIKSKMDDFMGRRMEKQPLEYPSAGSTFKRPEGSYASLLIEQCGLKGFSIGGAEVSQKHSGFIINKGGAAFDDLIELIAKVREIVFEKTGYMLECEPRVISDR